MINATLKFPSAKVLAAGALLTGALFAGQSAMACQTTAWDDAVGAVTAGDPANDSIARYSGLCGLQATGQGFVQDNSPGGIDRIVARFYVLNNNSAPAEIYAGYSATDGTSERFLVELDDAGQVTLTDNVSGQSISQTGSTNWLSVEIDWAQGAGSGFASLSVNGQAAEGPSGLTNSGAALQSVRLGNLDGAAGTLSFDSYESRRSTEVGRLVRGDANGDGSVSVFDAIAIVNESSGSALATGQPDCNEDGAVSVFDAICVVNVAAGP